MSVWEAHGVWASGGAKKVWVDVREVEGKFIALETPSFDSPSLTPDQARYLASKLTRLANRLDPPKKKEKT